MDAKYATTQTFEEHESCCTSSSAEHKGPRNYYIIYSTLYNNTVYNSIIANSILRANFKVMPLVCY